MTAEQAGVRKLVWIIAAALGLYLLGNGQVALWDRDEPRYAQTSRQMLQSGDWVVPHLYDKVRTAKPVFIYWCQAAAMATPLGDTAFAARLPSVVGMTLTLIVAAGCFWKWAGPRRTVWMTLILATSVLCIMSAKMSTTDAVLLLWITVAQLCLYQMLRGNSSWAIVIAMSIAIGLAGLTKGPVALGVMAMTLVAWAGIGWTLRGGADRHSEFVEPSASRRSIFPAVAKSVVGAAIVAAIVGPWLYLVHQRESTFLGTSVSHDVFTRIVKPLEGHRGPPGFHLATIFGTFLPWSVLLPLALAMAWKRRAAPLVRFCLAAVVGPWLMFEIVQTKLPHYLLPVFPPLAFLTADAIVRCLERRDDALTRRGFIIAIGIWGTILTVLGSVPWLAARHFDRLPLVIMALMSVGAFAYAGVVFWQFINRQPGRGLGAMGVGFGVIMALMYGLYLPRAHFLRLSIAVADILKRCGATEPGSVEMLDYKEPSLAFYQGGAIRENRATVLNQRVLADAPQWLVITDEVWKASPPEITQRFEPVGGARGFDLADGGRVVHVFVIRKLP